MIKKSNPPPTTITHETTNRVALDAKPSEPRAKAKPKPKPKPRPKAPAVPAETESIRGRASPPESPPPSPPPSPPSDDAPPVPTRRPSPPKMKSFTTAGSPANARRKEEATRQKEKPAPPEQQHFTAPSIAEPSPALSPPATKKHPPLYNFAKAFTIHLTSSSNPYTVTLRHNESLQLLSVSGAGKLCMSCGDTSTRTVVVQKAQVYVRRQKT